MQKRVAKIPGSQADLDEAVRAARAQIEADRVRAQPALAAAKAKIEATTREIFARLGWTPEELRAQVEAANLRRADDLAVLRRVQEDMEKRRRR